MNRRKFLQRLGLIAAVPVAGKVVPETPGIKFVEDCGTMPNATIDYAGNIHPIPAHPSITFTGDSDVGFVLNDSENTISFYDSNGPIQFPSAKLTISLDEAIIKTGEKNA